MTDITLYHNPACSKSRSTLAILEDNGHKPSVVLYLETPLNVETLEAVVDQLGVTAIDIVRSGEAPYLEEMTSWSDMKLFEAIKLNPILLQRPIVVANGKARIGRPPESVLEIV